MPLYNPAAAVTPDSDATVTFTDITTNNSSTSKHGFLKKLDNVSTHFMDGTGAWGTPSGTGAVASDTIWDTKGDLAVATAADTAQKLAVGSNGQVLTADSAQTTGVKWATAAAGSFTHTYVGYDTIGGSTENLVSQKIYLKKVTIASACMIESIGVYLKQLTAGSSMGIGVALLDDVAGTPTHLIAENDATSTSAVFLSTSNGAAGDARWVHRSLGYYATAADYWLAVWIGGTANQYQLYYDGSGSDQTYLAAAIRMSDAGWTTVTTTSNKYSIRASTIA